MADDFEKKEDTDRTTTASLNEALETVVDEKLLGEKTLGSSYNEMYLVRVESGYISEDLAKEIQCESVHPVEISGRQRPIPVIVGPVERRKLREMVERQLLGSRDSLLGSFGRWLPVADIFADVISREFTNTSEVTSTSVQVEQTKTLDLESENKSSESPFQVLENTNGEKVFQDPAVGQKSLDLDNDSKVVGKKNILPPSSARLPQLDRKLDPKISYNRPLIAAVAVAFVCFASYLVFIQFQGAKAKKGEENSQKETLLKQDPSLSWPKELRPKPTSFLYENDSPLVQKIRHILISYQRGAWRPGRNDLNILKRFSRPATASPEARYLASNQMAVFYLLDSKSSEAINTLRPIHHSQQSDFATILNLSMSYLVAGELQKALDLSHSAIRLCNTGECWLAYSLSGIIESFLGNREKSEKQFQNALDRSPQNIIIYGAWISSLIRESAQKYQPKILVLLKKAMWSDPDLLIDSPIPSPVGGHILIQEAMDGLTRAKNFLSEDLSRGQMYFLDWLVQRSSPNSLDKLDLKALEALSLENDLLSQQLRAYLLSHMGNLNASFEVISSINHLLRSSEVTSSWPLTFAGDVQLALKRGDQAMSNYSSALHRNIKDVSAVYGMAVALRSLNRYADARQKLRESLSLDPNFIPARLRISRFEWQRRYANE